jgi:hypothetical protein
MIARMDIEADLEVILAEDSAELCGHNSAVAAGAVIRMGGNIS